MNHDVSAGFLNLQLVQGARWLSLVFRFRRAHLFRANGSAGRGMYQVTTWALQLTNLLKDDRAKEGWQQHVTTFFSVVGR
jgi:hypothetical protein